MAINETVEQFKKDILGDKYVAPVEETKQPIVEEKKEPIAEPVKSKVDEMSDADLLALLNKRNINVSSLDDLKPKPTAEQLKAAEEERKNKMLAFGIGTGKVKKEEYDAFIQAQSNKVKMRIDSFESELREEHPELTEEQIQDSVKDYTLSYLDEGNIVRKKREAELEKLGDYQLKEKYSNIHNLSNEYEKYEQSEASKFQLKRKVEAGLPVYQADVEKVIDTLKNMDFVIEDKENPENTVTIPFEVNQSVQAELRNAFLNGEQAVSQISNGYTVENLTQQAKLFLIEKNISGIVSNTAKKYNSILKEKYINGRKGIIPEKDLVGTGGYVEMDLKKQFAADIKASESKNSN